jgi:hypothetical protein
MYNEHIAKTHVIPYYTRKHTVTILYILEGPSSWSTSRMRPSWSRSRLEWASCWFCFPSVFLVCSGTPGVLLFAPTDQVSHLTPSLQTGWLLTNVQVNNMAMLHGTFTTHIYTSHCYYYSSSSLYFFHSLLQAGWPRPFPSDAPGIYRCGLSVSY